jgi:hypothetical protein
MKPHAKNAEEIRAQIKTQIKDLKKGLKNRLGRSGISDLECWLRGIIPDAVEKIINRANTENDEVLMKKLFAIYLHPLRPSDDDICDIDGERMEARILRPSDDDIDIDVGRMEARTLHEIKKQLLALINNGQFNCTDIVNDLFKETFKKAREEVDFTDHDFSKFIETKNKLMNNLACDLFRMRSHNITKALLEAIIANTKLNEERPAVITWLFTRSIVFHFSYDENVPSFNKFSHVKSNIETFMSGNQQDYDLLADIFHFLGKKTLSVIFKFWGQTKTLQFRDIREEYIKLLKELVPEVSKPIESESDPLRNLKEEIGLNIERLSISEVI